MKNKIQYIEERNIGAIREKALFSPKTRLVEVDGKKYGYYADFVEFLEFELSFPRKCGRTAGYINRCDDWMRDLLWEDYDEYVFIIYNYKWFLFHDCFGKGAFFNSFEEYTKFWEYGVENCMVDGKSKVFNLYLVVDEKYGF